MGQRFPRTFIHLASAVLLLAFALPAFAGDEPDSRWYVELDLNGYAGKAAHGTQEAYVEFAVRDSVTLWANPYHEAGYSSATLGLAKTVGHWTFAIGAGQNRANGARANIVSPWLGYETDTAEVFVSVERYDDGEPAAWQGYAQRRFGRHFFGLYGETGFGIGPALTFVVNGFLRLRLAVPAAERGDTRAMATVVVVYP